MWFEMHFAPVAKRRNMCRDQKVLRFKPVASVMLGEVTTFCIDLGAGAADVFNSHIYVSFFSSELMTQEIIRHIDTAPGDESGKS